MNDKENLQELTRGEEEITRILWEAGEGRSTTSSLA